MLVRVVDKTIVFLQLCMSLNARKITAPARKLVMLVAVSFDGVVVVVFVGMVNKSPLISYSCACRSMRKKYVAQ